MNIDPVRDAAVGVLLRVFEEDAYLGIALDHTHRRKALSPRGRRFLTQLVYGTVRYKLQCDYVLKSLLHQPLEDLPKPILAILRMGVFQALYCRQVTFPSMVHTSVDLARRRGHAGTSRLANAVLRRVPQRIEDVAFPNRDTDPVEYLSVYHAIPRWLVESWIDEYGIEMAEEMCRVSNVEAPGTIRCNTLRNNPDELADTLRKAGYAVEKRTTVPDELTLVEGDTPPARSKQFLGGEFFVQDAASMLPAHLMEPIEGERVLDLCAAPGGKATHLAQLMRDRGLVVAMDANPGRLGLVADNVARLKLPSVATVCGDGTEPPFGPGFDRVLVDAPCTGLGTLRRHPDLKWRATPESRLELARVQVALLRSAVRLCKNGGLIVYSVCTFTREETVDVARAIGEYENVQPESGPTWMQPWEIAPGLYRLLPAEAWDGFFLMRLRKGC